MGDTYKALMRVIGIVIVAMCGFDIAIIIMYMTNRPPVEPVSIAALGLTIVVAVAIVLRLIVDVFMCLSCGTGCKCCKRGGNSSSSSSSTYGSL